MSQVLYDSLGEKWRNFLSENFFPCGGELSKDDADEEYDWLVYDFCMQYGYSEKTKNFVFYDRWYDTFADDFYKELERKGATIIHNQREEGVP